jgi:hypothetical protein
MQVIQTHQQRPSDAGHQNRGYVKQAQALLHLNGNGGGIKISDLQQPGDFASQWKPAGLAGGVAERSASTMG